MYEWDIQGTNTPSLWHHWRNEFFRSIASKRYKFAAFCNFRAIFIGRWVTTVWAYDDRRGAHIVCAIYLWAIDEQSVFKNTSSFAVVCAAAKSTNWLQTRKRKRLRERERANKEKHTVLTRRSSCVAHALPHCWFAPLLFYIFPFFLVWLSQTETHRTCFALLLTRKWVEWESWKCDWMRSEMKNAPPENTQREREWAQSTLFLRRFVRDTHSALFFKPTFQFSSNFPIR